MSSCFAVMLRPVSYRRELTIVCDGCGQSFSAHESDEAGLPPGWVSLVVPAWIGRLHACSIPCAERIRSESGEWATLPGVSSR